MRTRRHIFAVCVCILLTAALIKCLKAGLVSAAEEKHVYQLISVRNT